VVPSHHDLKQLWQRQRSREDVHSSTRRRRWRGSGLCLPRRPLALAACPRRGPSHRRRLPPLLLLALLRVLGVLLRLLGTLCALPPLLQEVCQVVLQLAERFCDGGAGGAAVDAQPAPGQTVR
jgi:hypothetical protein